MKLLTLDALRPPGGRSGSTPLGFDEAARGYRLALRGLYTRGAKHLGAALSELEKADAIGLFHARALFLSGMTARAEANAARADAQLGKAAALFCSAGEPSWSALALALQVEAVSASGALEHARAALERGSAQKLEGKAIPHELASAVYHLGQGNLDEARRLADSARKAPAGKLLDAWAELISLEARMDQGRYTEVEEPLFALANRLVPEGAADELVVRALTLAARLRVEELANGGGDPAQAQAVIARASAYATHFPRYAALAAGYRASLRALDDPDDADRLFHRAIEALGLTGMKLEQGRAIARFAAFRHARSLRSCRALLARGRDVLSTLGAEARSQQLAALEGGGGQDLRGSLLGTQSMLAKSLMLGQTPGQDDIELNAVFEVNRAISSILELDPLLQRILNEVVKVLGAERGAVLLLGPEGEISCAAARGLDPGKIFEGELSMTVVEEVGRTQQVVLTDNAQLDARFSGKASVLATEIRSLMCAPLRTAAARLGYLYVDSTVKSKIFNASHVQLLEVFATQAAVSVANAKAFGELEALTESLEKRVAQRTAELSVSNEQLEATLHRVRTTELALAVAQRDALDQEMRVAKLIQERVLPARQVIERPGLSLFGRVEAASRVGGDFWTHLPLPDGNTLLLVGDVTGHGVGAGMLTAAARACCATLLHRLKTVGIEELFSTLSDVLHASAQQQAMMTAYACLVDPAAQSLTVASAGHPPALLVRHQQGLPTVEHLSMSGTVLGDGKPRTTQTMVVPYAPGDRLFLYTDGLTEAQNARGQQYRSRQLAKALLTSARLPLEESVQSIIDDVRRFTGDAPLGDDLTAVLCALGTA